MNENIERIEKWYWENTFHYKDFIHVHKLVKQKQRQGLSIGLCIPVKNEAKTIGEIIDTLKEALIEKEPLLDEFIVIDSQSEDETPKIVKEKGIKLYQVKKILPHLEPPVSVPRWGKGESVWKGIYVSNTDILVWLDGDIENINPRFVYGLVGPLLNREDLGLVKAFYQRPIRMNKKLHKTGGGRVTELLVRPFLNTFYPDLSKILQPLTGFYAIRREVQEQVPICTNYAVEVAMLIDIYKRFGLEVIGQSDIKEVIHRNRDLQTLAKLSFGIMQAVFNRLHIHGKVKFLREPRWRTGRYDFENIKIVEEQRPPMIEVKEYQEKFKDRERKWPKE